MSQSTCIVRPASSLEEAHHLYWPLIQNLGWSVAPEDCKTHYISTGPDSFLVVASENQPDKAEGCVVPLTYANGTGWVGYFCINEPHRGKGWGAKLFRAGLDHFKSKGVEVVGLDAVKEQVGTYARRGFVEKGLISVYRRASIKDAPVDGVARIPAGMAMVALDSIPKEVLVQSDCEYTGLERSRLWTKEALFNRSDSFGFALVDEANGRNNLEGWVLVRSYQTGFRLGPLVATTPEVAASLLTTVLERVDDPKGNFIAELWTANPMARKVFGDAGFNDFVVQYHRMWLNGRVPAPQRPGGKADQGVYAIFDAGEG
jgi:GNAT superfamily N-acetyltransferase